MRTPARLFLCLAAIVGFFNEVRANPWVQNPGHGIAILNAVTYTTERYFDASGHEIAQPRFTKYELNPYVEYGLSEDWTLGASLFLHRLQQKNGGSLNEDNWGLGNSEFFARRALWSEGQQALSGDLFTALPSAYSETGGPKAGRDDYDLGVALNAGQGFALWGRDDHFAALRAAYRYRHGALGDQVQVEARTGLRVDADWLLLPELQWTLPVQGSGAGRSVAGQNDYRLLKGQLSAVYLLDDLHGIQAGLFRHLDGENTGGGGGVLVSLWRRF